MAIDENKPRVEGEVKSYKSNMRGRGEKEVNTAPAHTKTYGKQNNQTENLHIAFGCGRLNTKLFNVHETIITEPINYVNVLCYKFLLFSIIYLFYVECVCGCQKEPMLNVWAILK